MELYLYSLVEPDGYVNGSMPLKYYYHLQTLGTYENMVDTLLGVIPLSSWISPGYVSGR